MIIEQKEGITLRERETNERGMNTVPREKRRILSFFREI